MALHLSEPTFETHKELSEHIDTYWAPQREMDKPLRDLYAFENPVLVPRKKRDDSEWNVEVMRSGMASWALRRAGAFYPSKAKGTVEPSFGPRSKTDAENANAFLAEAVDQLQEIEKVWRSLVYDCLAFGRYCDIVLSGTAAEWWNFPYSGAGESLDESHAKQEEFRRQAPLPIAWRHLPATSTWPASLSRMADEAISYMRMTVWDLEHVFKGIKSEGLETVMTKHGDKKGTQVTLSLYANREWVSYAILGDYGETSGGVSLGPLHVGGSGKGVLIDNYRHGQGSNPIRFGDGFTSSRKEPGYYWLPMVLNAQLIQGMDNRLSEWATNSRRIGVGSFKAWLEDEFQGEGAHRRRREFDEGEVWRLKMNLNDPRGNREDIVQMEPAKMTELIPDLVSLAFSNFQRITMLTAPLTEGVSADQSGAAIRFAHAVITEGYAPISESLTGHSKGVDERIFEGVVAFKEEVPLQIRGEEGYKELTMTPEAAKGWKVRVKSTLEPTVLAASVAKEGIGIQLLGMGPEKTKMPYRHIFEKYFREDNPQELIDESYVDAGLNLPEVQKWLALQAVQGAEFTLAKGQVIGGAELLGRALSPGLQATLQQRGAVPGGNGQQRNPAFPAEATPQSIRQGGESSGQGAIPTPPGGGI